MTDTGGGLLATQQPGRTHTVPSSPDGLDGTAWRTRRAAASGVLRTEAALTAAMILLINVPYPILVGGTVFGPGDVMSGVLILVTGTRALRDGRRLSRVTIALFAAVVLATSIVAVAGANTSGSVAGWLRFLQLFALVPLAVVLSIRNRRDVLLIVHAMILGAVVQGVLGVYQTVTATGGTFQGRNIRSVGTFGSEDVIAMSVVVGLAIVLSVGLALSSTGPRRLVYAGIGAFLFLPLFLSLSRGSLIDTVVALVVVLAFAGWRVFVTTLVTLVAVLVVVVGGLGVGAGTVGDRVTSIFDPPDSSINDRTALRTAAARMWVAYPVTGVGLKAFPLFRDTYAPAGLSPGSDVGSAVLQPLLSPHNQYLLVLSEQGSIGGAPFLALLLVTAGAAVVVTVRGPPVARGLGAGIVGIAGWQLVSFYSGDLGGATSLLTSVIIGVAAWWGLEQGTPEPGPRTDP